MGGKLIKGTLDMRKIVLLFVFMILISASFPRITRGRLLAGDFVDDEVEQILLNCGLHPENMKSAINDLDLSPMNSIATESSCGSKLCINGDKWEAFSPPLSQLKHALLDCLSKHNILFQVSGEDDLQNRYSDHVTSLTMSRRHLADQPNISLPPTLAPSPSPSPSPCPSLPPSPSLSPSPGKGVQTPSYSPSPSYELGIDGFFPSPSPFGPSPQISEGPSSEKGVVMPSKDDNRSKKTIVITVVIVTVGATVIAGFLICCCCRCFRKTTGSENGQKDDRPLLNLSMSDFSGSSYNSGFGNAVQNYKIETSSIKTDSALNGHIVTLKGSGESLAPITTELSNVSSNAVGTIPPLLPPLKPPPGREMATTPAPAPPPPPPPKPKAAPSPPFRKAKPGPPPPPPPKVSTPPRPPQTSSSHSKVSRSSPLGPNRSGNKDEDDNAPKAKLKPLFWDKVSTNPEKSMVWNEIKSGSFQFNEEMIETLFGYRTDDKRKADGKKVLMLNDPSQYIQLLNTKKSQNLAISLKAMSVKTDEVSDALMEGNELPPELLQTLLRMAPTTDEELKLRLYNGDPSLLGPGEQFLKAMMDIPFAFKRMDALLFITSLPEEVTSIKESFASLEVACKELRSSRLFLKLLEAVLKLGNRMNDGTFRGGAQAFKLDTLLKLSDVKGADGKTTLLHFVVQEIIRSEGARAVRIAKESSEDQTDDSFQDSEDQYRTLGLKIVSSLSTELENVKKAAGLDADALTNNVAGLGHKLVKTKEFLDTDMRSTEEDSGFHRLLKSFVEHVEVDITFLLDEEKRIRELVKSTTDYFHGNSGRDEGLRLFVIVRDFLGMIDKACKEVRGSEKKIVKVPRNRNNTTLAPILDPRQHLFPAIGDRIVDSLSSDDES